MIIMKTTPWFWRSFNPINSDNDNQIRTLENYDSDKRRYSRNVEAQTTAGYIPPSGNDFTEWGCFR